MRTSKAKNFIVLTREEYVDDELKSFKVIRTFNWEALTLADKVAKDIATSTLLMLQQKPVRGLILQSGLMKYIIQNVSNEGTRIEFVKHFERIES
jgi:hypothetical protein